MKDEAEILINLIIARHVHGEDFYVDFDAAYDLVGKFQSTREKQALERIAQALDDRKMDTTTGQKYMQSAAAFVRALSQSTEGGK